jgi:hypothetical protein
MRSMKPKLGVPQALLKTFSRACAINAADAASGPHGDNGFIQSQGKHPMLRAIRSLTMAFAAATILATFSVAKGHDERARAASNH